MSEAKKDDAPKEPAKPQPVAESRVVVVRSNKKMRIGQEVLIGPHRLASDEPEPLGDDSGPTPYNLLAAALGSCTAMTITLYAQRKEWPLESVGVVLRHQKIDAEDCVDCRGREGKVDHIGRAIELGGPLTAEQRSRLLEIAERCPVRRTLGPAIHIESKLV